MEQDRSKNTNGEEVAIQDWNVTAHLAAMAQDYVAAELFRLAPFSLPGTNAVTKGVIPYGYFGSNGTDPSHSGIVKSTLSSSPALLVYPFRAIIGTIAGVGSTDPRSAWREVRSVSVVGSIAGPTLLPSTVNLSATVSNNRCDLVYLQVTLGVVTNAGRYVRNPSTTATTHPSVPVEANDTWSIGVAVGTEGASPTRPSLPSDSYPNFYIPLAYCYLVHPSAGTVSPTLIHEVAPVVPISRATGAASMIPASEQWNPSGPLLTATPFAVGTTPHRPDVYLPPTMSGVEGRQIFFRWDGNPKSPTVNTTAIVDKSIDWRNRVFRWHVLARNNSGATKPAWSATGSPSVIIPGSAYGNIALGQEQQIGMGQSFVADIGSIANGSGVAQLTSSNLAKLANNVTLFVDQTTGNLCVKTTADPGADVYFWLEASGPFSAPLAGVA